MLNLETLLTALPAYFVIMDPLGNSLIFNALTSGHEPKECRKIAVRAVIVSFLVVVGFGLFGTAVLARLGITMEAFRVAGGLLLFYSAFSMVVRPDAPPEKKQTAPTTELAVFPLSIPLMAGPGCLTLTVLLFSNARQVSGGVLSVTLAAGLILSLALLGLLLSRKIASTMGGTANALVKRLLGVLLASLSIQFVVDGIMGMVTHWPK